jgi:hypothetical protein
MAGELNYIHGFLATRLILIGTLASVQVAPESSWCYT